MVASVDQNTFNGHAEVRCFTCHEGHAHPLSHPQFPEEAAAEKASLEKAEAEHRQGAPGQPAAPPVHQ
jgi:cytochrome c553